MIKYAASDLGKIQMETAAVTFSFKQVLTQEPFLEGTFYKRAPCYKYTQTWAKKCTSMMTK